MDVLGPPSVRADDGRRWRRAVTVLSRRSGDSVLLLLPPAEEPMLASGAAAAVWEALVAPATVADLVDRAATETGRSRADLRPDVEEAVDLLSVIGVIEASHAPERAR